jgi:hypothetical protein
MKQVRIVLVLLVAFAALAFASGTSEAQVIINPTKIVTPASPDHNATFAGVAIVSSYQLVYRDGTTAINTQDCGKPTPDAAGKISCTIPAAVLAVKNKQLTVLVNTIGDGGTTPSVVSDFFGSPGAPAAAGKPVPTP